MVTSRGGPHEVWSHQEEDLDTAQIPAVLKALGTCHLCSRFYISIICSVSNERIFGAKLRIEFRKESN